MKLSEIVKYYNLAAIRYYRLRELGISNVKKVYNEIKYDFLNNDIDDYYDKVDSLKDDFIDENDIKDVLIYLGLLDYISSSNELDSIFVLKKPLNELYTDKVLIFKTFTVIERHSKANEEISCLYKNLMFFLPQLDGFEINNSYYFEGIEKIRIAVLPYPISDFEFIGESNKVTLKERKGLSGEDLLFLKTCNKALTDKSEVILTPEIVGSKDVDDELEKLFINYKPLLIISPSYHCKSDDKTYNQSNLLVLENNRLAPVKIYKNYPAQTSLFEEGIDKNTTNNIFVYHIKNFGKIGVFICKDFISNQINKYIDLLNLDVILVQCYTDNTIKFINVFRQKTTDKRYIILSNACAAVKEEEKIHCIQIGSYVKAETKFCENNLIASIVCQEKKCKDGYGCHKYIDLSIQDNEIKMSINEENITEEGEIDYERFI